MQVAAETRGFDEAGRLIFCKVQEVCSGVLRVEFPDTVGARLRLVETRGIDCNWRDELDWPDWSLSFEADAERRSGLKPCIVTDHLIRPTP